MTVLHNISWSVVIVLCVFLGGAPFVPEPHLLEKLRMLGQGTLTRAVDIFDMFMHGAPFLLLAAKTVRAVRR